MPNPPSHTSREAGFALVWAIVLVVIAAGLVAAFVMVSARSAERSGDAARRVANAATVQTAVTRVLYAFQNNLGSEVDYYVLDAADLDKVVSSAGGLATVVPIGQLPNVPAELTQNKGVWEHTLAGGAHRLAPINVSIPNLAVEERFEPDQGACTSAGLPAANCAAGTVRAYWQVVRIVMPDITGADNPNVVLVLRTWLGDRAAGKWSRASYARVELRPGRFADYQLIADGNMRFGEGALINGPVHSNGLDDGSFSTVHRPPGAGAGSSWVFLESGVNCQAPASITIRTGSIMGPGLTNACNDLGTTGQTISFLRAVDSIDTIEATALAGRPEARIFRADGARGDQLGRDAYHTAWDVTLDGSTMRVRRPDGSGASSVNLGRVNAFLFDEDVKVRGRVSPDVRVTIAARRREGATASIYIDGDIVKGDDRTSSIGLIAHGDIILWQTPSRPCTASKIQAAMVASTGGVTIPTKYTTFELQSEAPTCNQPLQLDGSIAGHRPPTLLWTWAGSAYAAGFTNTRRYAWDEQLKRNPPPFFPLTGTWQPFNVRDANVDCLFDAAQLRDPRCR